MVEHGVKQKKLQEAARQTRRRSPEVEPMHRHSHSNGIQNVEYLVPFANSEKTGMLHLGYTHKVYDTFKSINQEKLLLAHIFMSLIRATPRQLSRYSSRAYPTISERPS